MTIDLRALSAVADALRAHPRVRRATYSAWADARIKSAEAALPPPIPAASRAGLNSQVRPESFSGERLRPLPRLSVLYGEPDDPAALAHLRVEHVIDAD